MRYCATVDTHRASLPYVARFHAKRVLKFQDALLTSYHRKEVNTDSHYWMILKFGLLVYFSGLKGTGAYKSLYILPFRSSLPS